MDVFNHVCPVNQLEGEVQEGGLLCLDNNQRVKRCRSLRLLLVQSEASAKTSGQSSGDGDISETMRRSRDRARSTFTSDNIRTLDMPGREFWIDILLHGTRQRVGFLTR